MFYTLSKVLTFLLQPSSALWLAIAAGFFLREWRPRWHRTGLVVSVISLVALFIAGLSPVSNALLLPLEDRFPAGQVNSVKKPVTGIIVLGGAEDGWISSGRGGLAVNEAAERITETLRLALAYPQAKVAITGGVARLLHEDKEGSSAVAAFFQDVGVSKDRLIVETQSRNTYENATRMLPLINAKPGETWLIVTSAFHMPRSVGVFRKAGLDVVAYPVDFRVRGSEDLTRWFPSLPAGLKRFDMVLKEWAGLIAYRLTGRTNTLFPAP
jgi:uncharacterized SAM-binding protein YcdF (DUF218 family)